MKTVVRAFRTHYRKLLAVGGSLAVAAMLFLNFDMVTQSLSAAAHASPFWLAAAVITAALTVPASAICTVGASGREICVARTSAVELSANFVNRIAPAGIGRAMLSVKYLTKQGLTPERAVSAVAIGSIAGVITHVLATLTAWSMARHNGAHLPQLINPRTILIIAGIIVVALVAVTVLAKVRPQLADSARARGRALVTDVSLLFSDPRSTTRLLGGSLAVRLMYVACFVVSLRAAGIVLDPAVAALAFFAGSAVADVAPSPGGLGAAEVALAGAVVAVGVDAHLAVAGVMIYRLASYWMLSIAGYVSWLTLRRKGLLN